MIGKFFLFTVKVKVLRNSVFFLACCSGRAVYSKIRQIRETGFTLRARRLFEKSQLLIKRTILNFFNY
jgi:hypothetical protein